MLEMLFGSGDSGGSWLGGRNSLFYLMEKDRAQVRWHWTVPQ